MAQQTAARKAEPRDFLMPEGGEATMPPRPQLMQPGQQPPHPQGHPHARPHMPEADPLPRHVQSWKAEYEKQHEDESEYGVPEGSFSDQLYSLLWPASCWLTGLLNLVILVAVTIQMAGNYDPWKHAQVIGVSMAIHAIQAAVYFCFLKPKDK